MKKRNLLLMLLLAIGLPWAANAQTTVPYTEGFENMSSASDLAAAGWISYQTNDGSFLAIETSTSNVLSGSKALNIDSWNAGSSSDYVVVGLPTVNAAINTLQITFSYKVSTGTVYVGYLTDANDASTFVSLQSFSFSSSYTTKTVELNEAPASAARIAIKYLNWYRCYVDDIEVKALPSCLKPTSVTASPDGNITWEGEGRTWNLNYKASSASTWTEVNGLTSMSYTIPNLTSLTTYSVRVQNVCDDNTTTDWTTATFTTPAGIPLVEPFNSSSAPTGWTRYSGLLSGVMDGTVTLGTITSGWNFGTSNSVFDSHAYVNIYGSSCKYWLVTPALTMENNVQLSFDVAYTAYSGSGAPAQTGTDDKFVVLITTDGGTTWTILRQWDNAGSEYVLNNFNPTPATVTYDLSSYAGQSIAVAFYAESTSSNADNNLHIDNVSIDYIPSCFKPTDLNATNITANAAELSWTANSGESAWKLYWKKASDENYTEEAVTSNPYTLNGLDDNTEYVFYVVANCGGSDGESEPSNTRTFTTTCEAFEVTETTQYTYGFETPDLFACWTPIAGTAIQNNSNQAHESTYALKFSGTTNNMVALPPFVNATNTLRLEFWTRPENATNSSCGNFDVGYMTNLADANSFVAVKTYAYNDWTSAVFEKKTVDFANAPENAYIAMRQYNNSTSWFWFVDDVTVKLMPSCLAPTDLAANASTTSAELSWTANSGETAWTVYYKKTTDENYTEVVANATNPYTLNGLTAASNYQFYVVANCSAEEASEPSEVFTFATACDVIAASGYTENFDSYTVASVSSPTSRELPNCWNYINECTNSSYMYYPSMSSYYPSSYAHTGSNYLKFYSYYNSYNSSYDPQPQYAILPEMSGLAGKEVELYAIGYNANSAFKIGTMSDPEDANTFHLIAEQSGLTTYQKFSYIIPADRTDSYVAIMIDAADASRTYNAVYIDDITIKDVVYVDTYQIVNTVSDPATEMTWDEFADHVNEGHHFTHPTIELKEDIASNSDPITTMVGTLDHPFTGTFDGKGHWINSMDINENSDGAAPFHYIKDATIKNLHVMGNVESTYRHPGGLVGYALSGYNTIENCEVGTNLTVAGYGGGIIGHAKSSCVFLKGCVYEGGIVNTVDFDNTNCGIGALVGWCDGGATINIHDCFYDATNGYTDEYQSIYFNPVACKTANATINTNIYDCYYTCDAPAADTDGDNNAVNAGRKAYKVTGTEGITVDLPAATTHYSCSDIYGDNNATWNGIKLNGHVYGGEGTTLTLALDGAAGYEADHGTLTPSSTTYTLLMEADDTQISGVDCPVPYNVAVSNVEARSAQVTWTGNSDSYVVSYRTPGYFDGATEGFTSTSTPTGWENKSGLLSGVMEGTTTLTTGSQWSFGTSNGVFDNHARNNIYGTSRYGWLITPSIEVGNGYVLTFNLALTAYSGTVGTPSTAGTDDRFVVLVSTDDEATWTILREWNNSGSSYVYNNITCSATGENVSIDLSSYVGQTVRIAFYGESTVSNADNNLHIDNVAWGANIAAGDWQDATATASPVQITGLDPETDYEVAVKGICDGTETDYSDAVSFTTLEACSTPSEFTVGEVTAHTAAISWNGGNAESWTMFVKKSTETDYPASGEVVNTPAKTLESLDEATTYDVKIVAGCDDTKVLEVAEAFTTECDVFTVDLTHSFTEGFEGTTFAPQCWENIASGTHQWSRTTTSSNIHTGSGAAYSGYYGDIYLVMPDIQISSEADGAQLTFWSYNTWVSSYGKNSVVLINGENETELWSPESVSQSWVSTTIDLTAYMGQTISLAFKYEGDNAHGWYVDDVEVTMTKTFTKTIAAVGEEGWANGKGGYYFIASPVAEPVTPTADNGFIVGDYDLYYFSQTDDGEGNEWINFKDETLGGYTLTNGKGYLYASKEGTTLTFTGTPGTDGNVPLDAYDADARFKGWNLIGNPFAQTAYIDKTFYTLENSGTYTSNSAETAIRPMQGVLIIAEEDETSVTFTTEAPATNNGKLNMNLRRDNKQLDNAILVFGGEQQLGKISFREGSSKVYMPVEGKDYAITSVEGQVGEVPVSFKAENNGTYSLSFTSEEVSFSYLHLIDNMTGEDVDLLAGASTGSATYTFDARTTDYESRFKLVFAVGSSANDDTFGFVNASGNFCIFGIEGEATVQVIDVLGHVVSSETFSGSYEKRINGAPGVYMVRLIQGNDVKVQKVVVRR